MSNPEVAGTVDIVEQKTEGSGLRSRKCVASKGVEHVMGVAGKMLRTSCMLTG